LASEAPICPGQQPHASNNRHSRLSTYQGMNYAGSLPIFTRHPAGDTSYVLHLVGESVLTVENPRSNQQLELDIGASRGYPFDQFAIVIHQARCNRRSVGDLKGEKKGAEAATCRRGLITRRSLVRVQPPLPETVNAIALVEFEVALNR